MMLKNTKPIHFDYQNVVTTIFIASFLNHTMTKTGTKYQWFQAQLADFIESKVVTEINAEIRRRQFSNG